MKNDGGPAFPVTYQHQDADGALYSQRWGGMSLRDWFAGQALAGLCGSPETHKIQPDFNTDAEWAYQWADAMLKERSRE